jgi:predicted acylesterase/phospholipase RssA
MQLNTILPDPQYLHIIEDYDHVEEKLAIVCNGGGGKGRWEVGALYRLAELGILNYTSMIVGTSVGGLNALLFSKYAKCAYRAVEIWESIKRNEDIYEHQINLPTIAWQMVNKRSSILKPTGLYNLIDKEFFGKFLPDLPIRTITTATNLNKGISVFYDGNYDAADCARKTSAIPLAFPPIEEAGELYIDGGFGNNSPIATAVKLGATKIIVVGTMPDNPTVNIASKQLIDIGKALPEVMMELFENSVWSFIEDYNKLTAENPKKYPTVEFLDIYPQADTYDALDFTHLDLLQKGYDYAVAKLTPNTLMNFLHS